MSNNHERDRFRVKLSPHVDKILARLAKRDPVLHERVERQLIKVTLEPQFGKPLRYGLKNQRRVHVGSFVLLYEIVGNEIQVVDFDHHDKIYEKH